MRAMRAFVASANAMSFRRAADRLYLTASAVSHQVKQLEEVLGRRLFQRLPRGLKLTRDGQRLLDDLQPLLEQLDQVVDEHSVDAKNETVRLVAQPLFASELLVPRLRHFLDRHPEIEISVESPATDESCAEADASIRIYEAPPANCHSDRLFRLRLIPVGTASLYDDIRIVGGRVSRAFPIIEHDARINAWADWQKSAGISLPKDCPVIRLNSTVSISRAAEEGLGAALLPERLCASQIASGHLVPLFERSLTTNESYYFACNTSDIDRPGIAALRRWVLQEFDSER